MGASRGQLSEVLQEHPQGKVPLHEGYGVLQALGQVEKLLSELAHPLVLGAR